MDPDRCVPLRDSYEVFTALKKTRITVSDRPGYRTVDNPDLYEGFSRPTLWMGGAATKQEGWLLFLANDETSGWMDISSCRPEGMRECDVNEWREEIIEWLECFYGFHYR
jgi:hypothetical protein